MIRLGNALAALVLLALPVSANGEETKTLRPNNGNVHWDFTKGSDTGQLGAVRYQVIGDNCEELPQFSCTVLQKQRNGQWQDRGTETGGGNTACRVWVPSEAGSYRLRVDNGCGCTLRVQHNLVY